jgi:hypothetical protein
MTPISPQSWFLKCGIAAALALLVYAAIALAGPKAPPLPTSRDGALTILDRYVGEPVPDVLLVGSSLTARLNEEYFDTPNLKVLGLAGGSPITALDVALARDRLPGTILIEMNILDRGADPALVQKFRPGSAPIWPRPIRSAVALYERWHHAPPDRVRARAFAAALLQGLPSDFDNRIYVERALREWGTAPSDAIMTDNLATLQRLISTNGPPSSSRGRSIVSWSMIRKKGHRFSLATNAKRLRGDHAQQKDGAEMTIQRKIISLEPTLRSSLKRVERQNCCSNPCASRTIRPPGADARRCRIGRSATPDRRR